MTVDDAPRGYWWARRAPLWLWRWWLRRAYERMDAAENARASAAQETPANHPTGTPTRSGRGVVLARACSDTASASDALHLPTHAVAESAVGIDGISPILSMSADGLTARAVDRWGCVRPGCRAHAIPDGDGEVVEWAEVMGDEQHEHRLSDATIAWQDAKRCERDEHHLDELRRRWKYLHDAREGIPVKKETR